MNNVVEINGEKAVVAFDPEIQMLRGEFAGRNGGADFYAESVHDRSRKAVGHWTFISKCAGKRASSHAGNSPASSMSASIPKIMPQRSSLPQQRARA